MESSEATLLSRGLKALGLDNSPDVIKKFESYINEILLFNRIHSFVSTSDPNLIIKDHILDSLAPLIYLRREGLLGESAMDVGSGAGFPGIPLSIMVPNISWTLIEKNRARAAFLESTAAILHLNNIKVFTGALKEYDGRHVDLITFRAVTQLTNEWVESLLKVLNPNGAIASYKGRTAEIKKELSALTIPNLKVEIVPLNREEKARSLVIIKPPCP